MSKSAIALRISRYPSVACNPSARERGRQSRSEKEGTYKLPRRVQARIQALTDLHFEQGAFPAEKALIQQH
jgi:hypothetical protein